MIEAGHFAAFLALGATLAADWKWGWGSPARW